MYGNGNSLATYKKFEMMNSREEQGDTSTETKRISNSLFPKPDKKENKKSEELSPTDIAYKFYKIINKERLNARTE